MNVPTKLIILLAASALCTACNPVLRTHGYVPTSEKPQAVNPDTDTKTSVLSRLGNPSVKSTFDEEIEDDVWYYINSVRQRYAYLRPQIEDRTRRRRRRGPDRAVIKALAVAVTKFGPCHGLAFNIQTSSPMKTAAHQNSNSPRRRSPS